MTNRENALNKVIGDKLTGITLSNRKKWRSNIKINGIDKYLGDYEIALGAVRVRDIYVVHHYSLPDGTCLVPLNQIDGKDILSEEEIKDMRLNGIPQQYQRNGRKIRDLPKSIWMRKSGNYFYNIKLTRYFRSLERAQEVSDDIIKKNFGGPCVSEVEVQKSAVSDHFINAFYFLISLKKTCGSLEKTIEELNLVNQYFDKLDKDEKLSLEKDIDNYRNKDGIAVLSVYAGSNERFEVEVDDIDWLEYIHYVWCSTDGYAQTTINHQSKCLHLLIYLKMDPEYSTLTSDDTINHRDRSGERNDIYSFSFKLK